jgi:hypothetical protein
MNGSLPESVFGYIVVTWHYMTMEAFATNLHQMAGGYLTSALVDSTGHQRSLGFRGEMDWPRRARGRWSRWHQYLRCGRSGAWSEARTAR